jgi:hypothetical protein
MPADKQSTLTDRRHRAHQRFSAMLGSLVGVSSAHKGCAITRRPIGVAVVAIGAAAGACAVLVPTRLSLGVLASAVWSLLLRWKWRATVIGSLIVSAAISRWTIDVFGLTVNAERVPSPLCLAAVICACMTGRSRAPLGAPHIGLATYMVALFVASLLYAIDPAESIRVAVLAAVATVPFWILPTLVVTHRELHATILLVVARGAMQSPIALTSLAIYRAGRLLEVTVDRVTSAGIPLDAEDTHSNVAAKRIAFPLGRSYGFAIA